MKKQQLIFKDMIDQYLKYREVSGLKSSTTISLVQFYRDCSKIFSGSIYLTQSMVDRWCTKRDMENQRTHSSRIYPVITFLRHAKERNWIDLHVPSTPKSTPNTYRPHAFTVEELSNFFKACDEVAGGPNIQEKFREIQVPVFFRLLYSSGLRAIEGRLLRLEDVDFHDGIINVRYTKGYNEHRVVLHDTMRELLVRYDNAISKMMPDRKIFFPSRDDKCHTALWVSKHFNNLWYKYNEAHCVTYCLRHNYAIENINSWANTGYEVHEKLLALSKSMGHSSLKNTMYYYSLVPKLADIIENLSGEFYNHIIPNLPDDEK